MAEEACTINNDWTNDTSKSDELFFSLLGELLQNNTRATELYTLLSSQANNKSQFQNDNEYRCKEDAMEEDHDESDLNKLVDILKTRLQNGKSVPAGLTHEKLSRLTDDFLKQKEENKRTEQDNQNNSNLKKSKNAPPVLVTKPKPKNKKQLQAEQRRRELEMANIAKELEEKRKIKEEKEQIRKSQELERKRLLEEELRKQEEEKKRIMNENKKKKEKEEKEKEVRTQKEKERQDKLRKSQEEEQKRKEEEKRRKAEEKTAKQKALKEAKEREERDKLDKQLNQKNTQALANGNGNNNNTSNNTNKARSQQYQQYQQQQQKYPREVPPRFLRQQQSKQQMSSSQNNLSDYNNGSTSADHHSNWTEIVPDTDTNTTNYSNLNSNNNSVENWGESNSSSTGVNGTINNGSDHNRTSYSSWGGIPASEEWDSELNQQQQPISNGNITNGVHLAVETRSYENSLANDSNTVSKSNPSLPPPLVGSTPSPLLNSNSEKPANGESCWGASLTGSSWDNASAKQWDTNASSNGPSLPLPTPGKGLLNGVENHPIASSNHNLKPTISKSILIPADLSKTDCPGLTPWAGLDSFEATPPTTESYVTQSSCVFNGGAKPKTNINGNVIGGGSANHVSNNTETDKSSKTSPRTRLKESDTNTANSSKTDSNLNVSIDSKIDTNLKVTGWLERTTPQEDWEQDDKEENNHEEFGWTTVSMKTKKPAASLASSNDTSAKSDNGNAWTNRALKQLLDMGFKREHAEKALRDNNGIIESAVSDLLMKGDNMADPAAATASTQQNTTKSDNNSNNTSSNNADLATGNPPQKLNRKQRRKLQQLQNAAGNGGAVNGIVENGIDKKLPPGSVKNNIVANSSGASKNAHEMIVDMGLKQKGDGLLPTPPPSLRLVPPSSDDSNSKIVAATAQAREKTLARPQPPNPVTNCDPINSVVNSSIPQPIGQAPSKISNENVAPPASRAPIGSSRPSVPTPIQPPIQPPKSSTSVINAVESTATKETLEKMSNNTPLQPPTNPLLLAQMHLQKLGLETPPAPSAVAPPNKFPSPPIIPPPSTAVSSEAVTNSMIQQYLQQIAQTSKAESTPASNVSPISSSLHGASPMHLSGLLQQAPVPANSLSEGPQKSKLLQWTNPPMIDELPPTEEPTREKISPMNTIDPVSAKWGVVAMPQMVPTSEFKPGVRWKSREETEADEKRADKIDEENSDEDSEDDDKSDKSSVHENEQQAPKVVPAQAPPQQPVKQPSPPVFVKRPTPPPSRQAPSHQQSMPPPYSQHHSSQFSSNSFHHKQQHNNQDQNSVRPPPGLSSGNSFNSSSVVDNSFGKHKMDEMNWLTIRGVSNAIDPAALRAQCQQFGTLLDFRIIASTAYVRYETHAHARSAHVGMNGKIFYNTQLLVDISTEYECMKAIENSTTNIVNHPVPTISHTNHLPQTCHAPGFPNMSSFGGLWASPPPPPSVAPPPSVQQPFVQSSYTPNYAPQSSLSMTGGFAPWGPAPVLPDTSHLWRQAPPPQPPQPTNVFQAYPGWLGPKPSDVQSVHHHSIFSPAMDRCLPSELLNVKEYGS